MFPVTAAKAIRTRFSTIDAWFFQFSLAGYYANEDDNRRLQAAHDRHLNWITSYFQAFEPRVFIPFASFVYFCKRGNFYLNQFRVTPEEAMSRVPEGKAQLLWYGDELYWGSWPDRNNDNVKKWQAIWNSGRPLVTAAVVSNDDIMAAATVLANEMARSVPAVLRPGEVVIRLRESGSLVSINLRRVRVSLVTDSSADVDAEVGDDDFLYFCKCPWGADTLNITGNLKINKQFRWRWIAYIKHCSYVFKNKSGFMKGLIAIAGASLRSLQYSRQRI